MIQVEMKPFYASVEIVTVLDAALAVAVWVGMLSGRVTWPVPAKAASLLHLIGTSSDAKYIFVISHKVPQSRTMAAQQAARITQVLPALDFILVELNSSIQDHATGHGTAYATFTCS